MFPEAKTTALLMQWECKRIIRRLINDPKLRDPAAKKKSESSEQCPNGGRPGPRPKVGYRIQAKIFSINTSQGCKIAGF